MAEPDSVDHLNLIFDLLDSAGFIYASKPEISVSDKLAGGIAWCIANLNAPAYQSSVHSVETLAENNKIEVLERIAEDLRLLECPYQLQASKDGEFVSESVFPVVQWLAERIRMMHDDRHHEITQAEHTIEEAECPLRQLEEEYGEAETSIKILEGNLDEQNQRKLSVLEELQQLQDRVNKEEANAVVQKLVSLAESLKDLEQQESEFQSNCNAERFELQAKVIELEGKLESGFDSKNSSDSLDHSLNDSLEKLVLGKKELASKLRTIIALKRQLDDIPTQSELIQYERRFSELYVYIQGKLAQTRKYYATYNALVEVKELMLKETSLLNSISTQFQDAISSTAGRMKLIDSMEGIVKGLQQKLEKVELGLQEEQKVSNAFKERYAAAIAEQRQCYSLLKAFQEECAKNERLGSQTSIRDTVPIS